MYTSFFLYIARSLLPLYVTEGEDKPSLRPGICIMSKNILMDNVRMDTQTAYFVNGDINIYPAAYEHPEAMTANPTVSYPARITVMEDGNTRIRPYKIGSNGPRYKVIYRTEHCDVQLWNNNKIVECWKFAPKLSIHDIWEIRKREMPLVTAFFLTLK